MMLAVAGSLERIDVRMASTQCTNATYCALTPFGSAGTIAEFTALRR